jgi:hypothetical protein
MHRGYVKLWRKAIDTGWLKSHKLWAFWSYCLLKATHKDHEVLVGFQKVQLLCGQFIFGRKVASVETGLSEQEIRTLLKHLEKLGNLTSKPTNKYTIITIENWADYQEEEQKSTSKSTRRQPASNQHLTTYKHINTETQKEKELYLECVYLFKEQYDELVGKFGLAETHDLIQRLNDYMMSTGNQKKYKSHYHTIKTWSKRPKTSYGGGRSDILC